MSKNGFGFHSRPICLLDQPSNDKPAVSFVLYRGALNDKKVAELADCESDFWGDYMTDAAAVISVTAAVKVPPHGPEDWREIWRASRARWTRSWTNLRLRCPSRKPRRCGSLWRTSLAPADRKTSSTSLGSFPASLQGLNPK